MVETPHLTIFALISPLKPKLSSSNSLSFHCREVDICKAELGIDKGFCEAPGLREFASVEYVKFYDEQVRPSLKDIVWSWQGNSNNNTNNH
ncbi:hypothetical protein RJT34_13578 [Clitoria ternatea]|uniref:Uncharacterized protein n=1 Tax=Clitoria ternatea TaxID=43366 RepID=A0AAN9JRD5_CLITE